MAKPIPIPKSGPFSCEDISHPIRIAEPGGAFREQPVIYRCRGLVVTDNTGHIDGPNWAKRRENGWHSDEIWSVTHESTGTYVCCWEGGFPAVCAAQVLLALPVDWQMDAHGVREAIWKDRRVMDTISALRSGRMVMVERQSRRAEREE